MTRTDERELARLSLDTSTLSDALREFGAPAFQDQSPPDPPNPSLIHSALEIADAALATVSFATGVRGSDRLLGIRVHGTRPDLMTGAGLCLGANLDDAARLYGPPTSLDPPTTRLLDGTPGVSRQPRVGDQDTIVNVLDSANFLVESVDDQGYTIWLADFHRDELDLVQLCRPR